MMNIAHNFLREIPPAIGQLGLMSTFIAGPLKPLSVQGSGFRVQGSLFRVQGSGFRLHSSEPRCNTVKYFRTFIWKPMP
jgi:hypothetical protein